MKLVGSVNAQGVDISKKWPLAPDITGIGTLGDLVTWLVPKVLIVAGMIFFFLIVFAGVSMLTAAGSQDPAAKEKWRAILTQGFIGLIIVFAAFWIMQLINYVTGGALGGVF